MRCGVLLLAMALCAPGVSALYELRGRLVPGAPASISLHGAGTPFEDRILADDGGRFRFRDLQPGAYVLAVFVPGRGEVRRTVEVGPSQARAGNRIELTLELRDSDFESQDSLRRTALVSAQALSIPDHARREYEEASKRLARRDVPGAVAHLDRAVAIAPHYAEAWNHLGTIAYQSRDFERAESCFRKSLAADPQLFQPLVNLGGVLINLRKFEESLQYNLYAALTHPQDALANSQLGMSYFFLDQIERAQKYLTAAKNLDPAHFSHPQLMLAQIALRRHDRAGAAAELQEFLQYHPDAPQAPEVKQEIARLTSDPVREFAATRMAQAFSPGGHATGLTFSKACMSCHASGTFDHPEPLNCGSCHTADGDKPGTAVCLRCHAATASASGHGPLTHAGDQVALNSAAFRLFSSRCYVASDGKLSCTGCHQPHTFSASAAGVRSVCRGCHPTQHNSAALDCARCHMPTHAAAEAPGILVRDHRIQRPL